MVAFLFCFIQSTAFSCPDIRYLHGICKYLLRHLSVTNRELCRSVPFLLSTKVLVTSFIRSPTQKRGFYLLRRCDGICEKLQSSLVGCNRALFFVFFLQIKVDFHDLLDFKNLGLFVQDFRRKSDKFNCSK